MKIPFFTHSIERHNKKNTTSILVSGFTLVELLVTISIFLIITSTVIFNYGDFKSNVSLQNNTDDIALSIRKAQSFAIGAKGVNGGNFNNSYGIHFSVDSEGDPLDGSDKSFLLFSVSQADINKGYQNSGGCGDSNTCMELFNINSSDKVKEILLDGATSNGDDKASLDIIFTRPNPRATFCYRQITKSSSNCDSTISSAVIVVSNGKTGTEEKCKKITVQNTGQISIETNDCQ